MTTFDFIVVGAGIAGASMAAQLAESHDVLLVDMEQRAGYHTTSRSAACYEPNYGPPPMLALTRASEEFLKRPPRGFTDTVLLSPRTSLYLEAEGQAQQTQELLQHSAGLQEISIEDATKLYPVLRADYAKRCFFDPQTADIDVDALHQGFLRLFKARGGRILLDASLENAVRRNGIWHVTCGAQVLEARVIVNAAGAWGDVVAQRCGASPIGLIPKRRSIAVVPMPEDLNFHHWPMVIDVAETWYSKPQSGKLIVSSADATAVEPHDAYGDDMAIAEGVDRLMTATTITVERLEHTWGGLRTFARDGNPVVGFDPHTDDFFWLVGQGGYGIQSSPALSAVAADMARHKPVAENLTGLDLTHITPERFRHV